jgi:hypothetical protein
MQSRTEDDIELGTVLNASASRLSAVASPAFISTTHYVREGEQSAQPINAPNLTPIAEDVPIVSAGHDTSSDPPNPPQPRLSKADKRIQEGDVMDKQVGLS